MTLTTDSTATHVTSRDGTRIAYWTSGEGGPLILIHGTTADHTRWTPLLPYFEPHATVHIVDRRGRGGSGDTEPYDVEREHEDVAAVIDAIATSAGSPVDVLGHSYGALCAYGAAQLTSNIGKLVLYEGWPLPEPDAIAPRTGLYERMDAAIAGGDREKALELFFEEVVRMPDDEFAVYRSLPAWKARVAAAHTITREELHAPAFADGHVDVAAALPDARVIVLAGQQHVAMDFIPQEFCDRVLAFIRQDRPAVS